MANSPQLKNWFQRYWYERHRATARFIQACYDELSGRNMSATQLHALCRLTWCNRSRKETASGVAESTHSLVAPSLMDLFGTAVMATSSEELVTELTASGRSKQVLSAAKSEIGFVSFYAAFRATSRAWVSNHQQKIREIFADARSLSSDAERRNLYARVAALPNIQRQKGGSLPAANLLTPVIACLDPQMRCPIINKLPGVVARMKAFGLHHAALPDQLDGFLTLVGKPGIPDVFVLDVTGTEMFGHEPDSKDQKIFEEEAILFEHAVYRDENLPPKDEDDVKVVSLASKQFHAQLHNRMTNALLQVCTQKNLSVKEGRHPSCRFDALVRNHQKGRDLLIEVKSTTAVADIRLAIGQLLDYRRQLPKKATTDIAVLLPSAPGKHVRTLLDTVKVKTLWFTEDLKNIQGV